MNTQQKVLRRHDIIRRILEIWFVIEVLLRIHSGMQLTTDDLRTLFDFFLSLSLG